MISLSLSRMREEKKEGKNIVQSKKERKKKKEGNVLVCALNSVMHEFDRDVAARIFKIYVMLFFTSSSSRLYGESLFSKKKKE